MPTPRSRPQPPRPPAGAPAPAAGRRRRWAARLGAVAATCLGLGLLPSGPAGAVTPAPLFSGQGVSAYGGAPLPGSFTGPVNMPLEAMAPTPDGRGYWVAAADGGVFAFGDAPFLGSMGGTPLYAPVVGMAGTGDGRGYWLAALDGGVFAFGDAPFAGSMGGHVLNSPVVGMAATPDGRGYWLVAADGGVFAFGDAPFLGSMGGTPLNSPVSGMAPTADGRGYWLVAQDGGVFAFGDAHFYGSAANQNIGTWVTGISPTHDDGGYWLVAATAGVLTFGDAAFDGPSPNLPPFSPTAALAASPTGAGYWLLQPDSVRTLFPGPASPDFPAGRPAAEIAASQIGPDPDAAQGSFCNPYGPCEEWCALFATWVWEQAGIPIPRYAFTGSVYDWSAAHGQVLPPTAQAEPGDGILFGTGPQSTATSVHIGVVAAAWPDGAVITVEGDSGPEPDGQYAVTMDGPFLPSNAVPETGMPVYAIARP